MVEPINISLMLDQGIRIAVSIVLSFAKQLLIAYWPYMVGFFVIVMAGVVLQIIMLKSGTHNKLSGSFNRLIGSLTWSAFFLMYLSVGYWIFGTQVIDKLWFTLFGSLSFPSTWLILKAIGFWYY